MTRGHTNLLTGSVRLLDLPSNALLKYVLKNQLPWVFLPSFLHEATHWWFLASDLGAALGMLELRAHREGVMAGAREHLAHDVAAVDLMHTLLGPLLEGTALFVEFDSWPGEAEVWSEPSLWVGSLFRGLDDDPPPGLEGRAAYDWLSDHTKHRLIEYRTSIHARHRKTEVLMQPFSDDPHLYLAGYLAVKNIWRAAVRVTPKFFDRDFFLSFLRLWICQDWRLIEYLLDDELSPEAIAYLVSERLQQRIRVICTENLDRETAAFEAYSNGPKDGDLLLEATRLDEFEVRAGNERINALLTNLGEEPNPGGSGGWADGDALTLIHRQQFMRLAIEAVDIEVNVHHRAIVRKGARIEDTYMAGPAPDGAEIGVTPGWMTAYFVPEHHVVAAIAVRHNQPIMWFLGRQVAPDSEQHLRIAATKVADTEAARTEAAWVCRRWLLGEAEHEYAPTLERFKTHVRLVYQHYALASVPEAHVGRVTDLLDRKGVYTLLGGDGDLLTALTILSLEGLIRAGTRATAADDVLESGLDLELALARLKAKQEATAFPLFVEHGGDVYFLV